MIRSIQHILPPPPPHMVGDGFRVHNFFPGSPQIGKYRMSPFFLMDYGAKIEFGPSNTPRGVGVHPHRGFETVTIAYKGRIAHHDSACNSGVIGEGDVQWMTAASGVLHKEYHELEYSRKGGPFHMVQLWVNLPAKDKMSAPKYQEITNGRMGKYQLAEEKGVVEVIAGNFNGVQGPASTFTPIELYNLKLKSGAAVMLNLPENYNTGFLVAEGSVRINGQRIGQDHFVLFANEPGSIEVEASADALVLVLSGEPINEQLAAYGPFLMNTIEELEQAVKDVNAGKFGELAE